MHSHLSSKSAHLFLMSYSIGMLSGLALTAALVRSESMPVATQAPTTMDVAPVAVAPQNVDESVVFERTFARHTFDKMLDGQQDLKRDLRIVPEQVNGKVIGIRVFGVRPDNVAGIAGLQNGDRIERVNGMSIAEPEMALSAYALLRVAQDIAVNINRRGRSLTIRYHIV